MVYFYECVAYCSQKKKYSLIVKGDLLEIKKYTPDKAKRNNGEE